MHAHGAPQDDADLDEPGHHPPLLARVVDIMAHLVPALPGPLAPTPSFLEDPALRAVFMRGVCSPRLHAAVRECRARLAAHALAVHEESLVAEGELVAAKRREGGRPPVVLPRVLDEQVERYGREFADVRC